MSAPIELRGIDGANPLGFLAALGIIAVAQRMGADVRLGWSDAAISRPLITGVGGIDDLVDVVAEDREAWEQAAIFRFPADSPASDVKFSREQLGVFVRACDDADDGGRSSSLCGALVAERVLDENGKAKPTDLHFTAGQQQFVAMARQLAHEVTTDDVREALLGWRYERDLPSLRWDVSDDRAFALTALNPSKEKKLTVPGAEWLALQGLTLYQVAAAPKRVVGPGMGGSWKRGTFSWPLWEPPVTASTAAVLGAQVAQPPGGVSAGLERARRRCGVLRVFESAVRRSDQGGYGSFGPPRVVWER